MTTPPAQGVQHFVTTPFYLKNIEHKQAVHELGAEGGHLPAPPNSRLILLALADRCGPDGRSAWPTVETLSLEAHCSESSVRRALKALEQCGTIRRGDQRLAQWDENRQ